MRLVHLADLHLGFRQYYRLTPTGINQREADVALAFRRAIDQVIALRPELVLVAGDVFHTVRPQNPAIIDAFVQFQRLVGALPETRVVMIAGNHDRPRASETGCILKLFTRIGIEVVSDAPKRIELPELELSVLAVPNLQEGTPPPALSPDPAFRHNVLMCHLAVQGVLPTYMEWVERATMSIDGAELHASRWSYVALGHYHVYRALAPNAYYSGSIEYTSPNAWAELVEERAAGLGGKGFIEYDLDACTHRFHAVPRDRRLIDLPPIPARGMSAAELDAALRERVDACPGGIDDAIVRLLVRDVPRHVARELDHRALREYERRALHFQLDTRKPETVRVSVSGGAGRRPTLKETVASYLGRRELDPDVDRAALVALGVRYLDDADSAAERSAAPPPVQGAPS